MITSIKRYKCDTADKRGSFGDSMSHDTNGEWVRYSDMVKRVEKLEHIITVLKSVRK